MQHVAVGQAPNKNKSARYGEGTKQSDDAIPLPCPEQVLFAAEAATTQLFHFFRVESLPRKRLAIRRAYLGEGGAVGRGMAPVCWLVPRRVSSGPARGADLQRKVPGIRQGSAAQTIREERQQ